MTLLGSDIFMENIRPVSFQFRNLLYAPYTAKSVLCEVYTYGGI